MEQRPLRREKTGQEIPADVAVIGAGAAGCMAALCAAQAGAARVLVLERNAKAAAKIYATGNGRCNLTNLYQDISCYHFADAAQREAGGEILAAYPNARLLSFFTENGVLLHDRGGYVYPRTDQASTVALLFERLLREDPRIDVRLGASVRETVPPAGGASLWTIRTEDGAVFRAKAVLFACGGMAGPQFGCGRTGYTLLASMGHSVRKPLPALVQLQCGEDAQALRSAQGTRFQGKITLVTDGTAADSHTGEMLFTENGVSGIPAMQVSGQAARALEEGRSAEIVIDLLPEVEASVWERETARRLELAEVSGDRMLSEWLFGLVPDKVQIPVLAQLGLVREKKLRKVPAGMREQILRSLRSLRMRVTGTGGFDKAQVTGGGIPLSEVRGDLSSKRQPGLFIAGELLDADGICGGYNLRWAFSTGAAAGKAAAEYAAGAAERGAER